MKSLYDLAGRLASIEDTLSGTIEFNYDTLDRLISEITKQGKVAYQYDAIGRRTAMVVNGGAPVEYGYDANSRLTQVSQGAQVVGLGYDDAGRRTSLSYPNGTNTSYTYDLASRLTRILHDGPTSVIEDLTYSYDAAGNRIRIGRLGPEAPLPEAVQAAYDAANEQIQFNNGTPNLVYDANGNLVSQTDASGTTTYVWDARNRLVGIAGPSVSASFEYDAVGRRTSKTINGVRTQYQYDGNDIVIEIGGSAVTANYLRSLNIDEPVVRQGNISEYYHADSLGSTLRLTDGSGLVTTSYEYESFGTATVIGTSANRFQYTGRENDGTGLYYYRARYYNSLLQRFISEDPIEFLAGSINLYSYVRNNPVNFIDPLGLEHEGFIKKLGEMADKSLRKTIKSLEKNLEQAIKDVANPNLAREVSHNLHKVRLFKTQTGLALKEVARRGLKLGILGVVLDDLLFPDEVYAGELELLKEYCPKCVPDTEPHHFPDLNLDLPSLQCGRKC